MFPVEIVETVNKMRELPDQVARTLDLNDQVAAIAREVRDTTDVLFLGRHTGYPAALEGALKLRTMQATWTVTAPRQLPLATAWHAPATAVSGTAALTLTLPKFAGVGDNLSVRFDGEVTGNAEQLFWTPEPRLHAWQVSWIAICCLCPTHCNGCCHPRTDTCGTGMSGAHQGATGVDNHTSSIHRRRSYTGAVRRSPRLPCRWKWSCAVWLGRALSTSRRRGRIGSWVLQTQFLQTC